MNDLKILVVEPDTLTVKLLTKLFENYNLGQIIVATNGPEGLNKVKSEKFDLIITEVELPIMDGLELIWEIKQLSEYKNIPIIINTASIFKDKDIRRCFDAGASDFIPKPFPNQKFVEKIKSWSKKNY